MREVLVGDVRVATLQTKQELESNLDSLDRRLRNLRRIGLGMWENSVKKAPLKANDLTLSG